MASTASSTDVAIQRPEPREAFVIEPRRQGLGERLRELRQYRRLLRYFGTRALDKLTARTVLGRWWLLLRPTLDVVIATVIFGGVLNIPSIDVPYPVLFIAGATCWRLFENSLLWTTRSLELNRKLISKVYFPRLLLPFAALAPALVEFAIYITFLLVAITIASLADGELYLRVGPELLGSAAALVMAVAFALGIGLWTSVLGANTRDVRFSLNYILGFWFFLTPVIYPLSMIPASYRTVAALNPMTPIVELFKWGLLDAGEVRPVGLLFAGVVIVATWAGGLSFFSRAEAEAVDRL